MVAEPKVEKPVIVDQRLIIASIHPSTRSIPFPPPHHLPPIPSSTRYNIIINSSNLEHISSQLCCVPFCFGDIA